MQTGDPHKSLANALGRIPSGIFILTLARDQIETGMLASWVQQCSFKPPLITFAVQKGRPIVELLAPGALLTLNILEAAQTDMIAHFGKGFALSENAFIELDIQRAPPHGPILREAHAYLHASVVGRYPAGDHDLFLAEVTAGAQLDDGQPMVHIRKNGFHY
ncbi:MAG: flavin reductase family protein [Planctomycetes bacterium]|nr:flavin reductase family protein [Planctomycetota bacterium]